MNLLLLSMVLSYNLVATCACYSSSAVYLIIPQKLDIQIVNFHYFLHHIAIDNDLFPVYSRNILELGIEWINSNVYSNNFIKMDSLIVFTSTFGNTSTIEQLR